MEPIIYVFRLPMTSKLQYCRDLGYDTDSSYKPQCPTILIDDLECNKYIDFEVELQNEMWEAKMGI